MSYRPINKRLFTEKVIETNQSDQLRAHSELAGVSDGTKWVEAGVDALPVATYAHSSVVFNGKMWIIGGYTGAAYIRKVYYSSDGITWTEAGVDALPVATREHTSVVFNGKVWVICGYTGARTRKVYYSADGVVWVEAGVDAFPTAWTNHTSVVFDGKMWVIGGEPGAGVSRKVYYSSNGTVWTEAGADSLPVATQQSSAVVYKGKMWLLAGNTGVSVRKVYYSTDGTTWTEAGIDALPVGVRQHTSIIFNGKICVICGYSGAATRKVYTTIPQQSGLVTNGPVSVSRRAVGVSDNILTTDYYLGCTAGGITLTLPTVASAYAGKKYVIKDETGAAAGSNIIIDGNGAETIDGSANFTLTSNYQSVELICTGTAWAIT